VRYDAALNPSTRWIQDQPTYTTKDLTEERMRIILDLTAPSGNCIVGTASWSGIDQPVAFDGWLTLMSLIEVAQRQTHGAAELKPNPENCH